jgi:hypothetical protein
MNRWFCIDCRNQVETDRHGRCGVCDSEAVILAKPETEISGSVSMVNMDVPTSRACA